MQIITPINKFGFATDNKLAAAMQELTNIRSAPEGGLDMSFQDYLQEKGFKSNDGKPVTLDEFFYDMGIEPNRMTVENLIASPYDTRWLVPEIIREAIRLGLRRSPIHPNIIRSEETVAQPFSVMPKLNFSGDATMDRTGEMETIATGYVSYGSKTVKISKRAKGIGISYEAIKYTNINLIGVFFEDLGVRMGFSLDADCIDVILNGDQEDGSESAPEIGVEDTADAITYYDLLRTWIRGAMIGRNYRTMIGDEASVLWVMNLPEFKDRQNPAPAVPLDVKIPIVVNPELYAHMNVTASHLIVHDNAFGLTQLTAAPLMVESEKIIRRQIEDSFASITTGFSKLFRDSSILIDGTKTFAGNPFPVWMVAGYAD